MKRFKAAFKAALIPALIGIVVFVVGVVLFIIFALDDVLMGAFIGIPVIAVAIAIFAIAYCQAKSRLHAICPECQKFMGDTNATINYSFVCNQYKENYDNHTNQFRDYTFYYTCTIVCPHCGSTSTFDYNLNAKNQSKANVAVDKYIKGILKLNK